MPIDCKFAKNTNLAFCLNNKMQFKLVQNSYL